MSIGTDPLILSVVMPVHNAAPYLAAAVESILAQSHDDFEFIIVDDGSTDDSISILNRYQEQDNRIVLIQRPQTGIVGALNDGLKSARGKYIARMDADDIALPKRLAWQLEYLKTHPQCVALGGRIRLIDSDGDVIGEDVRDTEHDKIVERLLRGRTAIAHPTVVMLRSAVDQLGGYRRETQYAEDLDLFLRLSEIGRLANLDRILLCYRLHLGSIINTHRGLARKAINTAVRDAHKRMQTPESQQHEIRQLAECDEWTTRLSWVRRSVRNSQYRTANKHLRIVRKQRPFSFIVWRYTLYIIPFLVWERMIHRVPNETNVKT